jgi:hypothetical protein
MFRPAGERRTLRQSSHWLGLAALLLLAALVLAPRAGAAIVIEDGPDKVTTPNYKWNFGDSAANVERVDTVEWRREASLVFGPNVASQGGGGCGDPSSEFWGQSYGNADGQSPGPVVAGSRGTWGPRGERSVEINSLAPTACSGDSPPVPIRTRYSFFDAGAAVNTVRVERRWTFASNQTHSAVLAQGMRAYVPRLPSGTYNQVVFPKADGSGLNTLGTSLAVQTDWNDTWVALNSSSTNAGLLILRDPASIAANPASVVTDSDGSSGSNNSGVSLDRPVLTNWVLPVTEVEYLCFYDATSWPVAERSPTRLPDGCKAASPPINVGAPMASAGAGNPRQGESFTANPGSWDNATGNFGFQWLRCEPDGETCTVIPGATGTSYTATAADIGKALVVRVTATSANGETDVALSSVAGSISGHVYEGKAEAAKAAKGAPVQVCKLKGSPCRATTTDATGFYRLQVPVAGDYRVTAFPPAGSNAASKTRETISRTKAETEKTGQDVVLPLPKPPPPTTKFEGAGAKGTTGEGVPIVHWQEPFVVRHQANCNAEAEARIEFANGQTMRISPSGAPQPSATPGKCVFVFSAPPLFPNHGAARMRILAPPPRTPEEKEDVEEEQEEEEQEEEEDEEEEEEEPEEPEEEEETPPEEEEDEEEEEEEEDEEEENEEEEEEDEEEEPIFPIYIDPSGFIRTVDGSPLPGATVTLLRSDLIAGPFTVVPDGSAVMSPMNRRNPDSSEASGHFGWDVIAGFYKVQVVKPGCHAPGQPAQPQVETAVMTIPPPVTNLDIRLDCPGPAAPRPLPPVSLRMTLKLPKGTLKVAKSGAFTAKAAKLSCPAASASPCTVGVKVKAAKKPKAALGASQLKVAPGKTVSLSGKLSKAGLKKLLGAGQLKAKISLDAKVPGGETILGSFAAKLVPKKTR